MLRLHPFYSHPFAHPVTGTPFVRAKDGRKLSAIPFEVLGCGLPDEWLARYFGMPIHEGTIGIILPSPNVQCVEGWQTEAVGSFKIMKELSHELRWRARMLCIPRPSENQIVCTCKFQVSIRLCLVENN